MELFASRGLLETLRAAPENSVVPVRVVRDVERTGGAGLRPLVEAPTTAVAPRRDVVVRLSSEALDLGRRQAPELAEGDRRPEPPPRGSRLDVVA